MRKQKLFSSDGKWGERSVQEPIKHCFFFYSKMKPRSMYSIWSSPVANPFASSAYEKACLSVAVAYENSMIGGRKPSSVAAAVVYGVSRLYGLGVKQMWVAKYFDVTEVSLRNNLKYLKDNNYLLGVED